MDRVYMQSWEHWQNEVVALLQGIFDEALGNVSIGDVDWLSWRDFYLQGRSPRAAIEFALERDL